MTIARFSVFALILAGLSGCVETTTTTTETTALRMAGAVDETACVNAVASKTNNSAVVLSSVTSEANNMVTIGVGPDRAPWKCLVNGGVVVEVMSLTDEGAL